jgi:hypothetical protein
MAKNEPWRNRIVGTDNVDPEDLLASPFNWRTHPPAQRNVLRGSLNEVGWVASILVNQRTGFVVDGHARIEEALSRHEKTVPVTYVDLSPEEEKIVLASFDPISAMAETNAENYQELVAELHAQDAEMEAWLRAQEGTFPKEDDKRPKKGDPTDVVCPACGNTFTLGVSLHVKQGT